MKFVIIDGFSMVSSDLPRERYSRLEEVFMIIPEKLFGGISVLTVADHPQLPPVYKKLLFSSVV